MGRHSRRGPAAKGAAKAPGPQAPGESSAARADAGDGRRTRGADTAVPVSQQAGRSREPQQTYQAQPPHGRPERDQQYGGTPARGVPQVRGGHPEQCEPGRFSGGARIPGPRQEFVEAFDHPDRPDGCDVFDGFDESGACSTKTGNGRPVDAGRDRDVHRPGAVVPGEDGPNGTDGPGGPGGPGDDGPPAKTGRARSFTGIVAAAVTTVLAVVVAGQVVQGGDQDTASAPAAGGRSTAESDASRSDARPTPSRQAGAAPSTYTQAMARTYAVDPKLTADGDFEAIGGFDKAPGRGQKFSYRVDVEKGLGLDGALFARAVQETLNDDRSWAHNGAKTFERISSGRADFVITLASPGTTGVWCAKSGLDTLSGNVSCDSAATERIMINAYRWAQGAESFGKEKMFAYRQMLINHEVGHRLGHGHKNCETPGALAPIMQQQTKSLDIAGIKCKPNPWVFPGR
ncbi:DUF3152 domain-containing protein [Streptomyces hypolithicus]